MRGLEFVFVVIFSVAVLSGPAIAVDVPASCDPDVMDVMNATAQMENRREVWVAQSLIKKPDSILQYSCFEKRIEEMGKGLPFVLGEGGGTEDYAPPTPDPRDPPTATSDFQDCKGDQNCTTYGRLNQTLDRLITQPLQEGYFETNFSHSGYGGAMGGGDDPCNMMEAVWKYAQCENFTKDDLFFTFDDLVDNDPRQLPEACNKPEQQQAFALEKQVVNPPPADPPQSGGVQTVNTHLEEISPSSCTSATPVPSGQSWRGLPGGQSSTTKTCPSGCVYDQKNDKCK